MRRNNHVFLMGTIVKYSTNTLPVDGELTPVMDLQVQTEASKEEPLEVTVLGWLHSQPDGAVVMDNRVTAIVPHAIRELAIESIRKAKFLHSSVIP